MSSLPVATSPVPALDFSALAQEIVRQPDLFASISAIQVEQDVVQAARGRRYTGARVPEARAAQIVALRLAGTSLRGIERQTGADKRTVAAVVEIAEQQGVVPPLKERLTRRMAELSDRTMDMVERELESDEPDAQLIKAGWVGVGIAADKSAAAGALGGASDLHQHLHLHVAGPEDPAAIYARMLSGSRPVDAQSEVHGRNLLVRSDCIDADTGQDTRSGPPGGATGALAGTTEPAAELGGATAEGGAGGVAIGGSPTEMDGKP